MKIKTKLILSIVVLALALTIGFYYQFIEPTPLDEYTHNPPCEFKQLTNGFTQIENCVKYKLKNKINPTWLNSD